MALLNNEVLLVLNDVDDVHEDDDMVNKDSQLLLHNHNQMVLVVEYTVVELIVDVRIVTRNKEIDMLLINVNDVMIRQQLLLQQLQLRRLFVMTVMLATMINMLEHHFVVETVRVMNLKVMTISMHYYFHIEMML